jgi:hypothetical protein
MSIEPSQDARFSNERKRKLLGPLDIEANSILSSKLRRRLGFLDERIVVWARECGRVLEQLDLMSGSIERQLSHIQKNPDTEALRRMRNYLDGLRPPKPQTEEEPAIAGASGFLSDISSVRTRRLSCFVMMPFAEDFLPVYETVILPSLRRWNCHAFRAEEIAEPGLIGTQVFRAIASSHFCIADITGNNSNVLYELGFSHALGKPTVILAPEESEDIPFDLHVFRHIPYSMASKEGAERLKLELERAIGTIATSSAAGFFLGGGDQRSFIPIIFALLIGILFFVAFVTTGTTRKNIFGLFLGLFNVFFWLGWYLSQRWSP